MSESWFSGWKNGSIITGFQLFSECRHAYGTPSPRPLAVPFGRLLTIHLKFFMKKD
jgi:hypothetical protein